jgi:hypothetical protein
MHLLHIISMAGRMNDTSPNNNRGTPYPGRPKSLFDRIKSEPRRARPRLPEPSQTSRSELISALKSMGRNWEPAIEKLLAAPEKLYYFSEGASAQYSDNENSGLADTWEGVMWNRAILTDTKFGVLLFERAGMMYFMLVDTERRIIVKKPLACYHDSPPEQDWGIIMSAIKSALSLAESQTAKQDGLFAVHNGALTRLVVPEWPYKPETDTKH